ncbi:neprilysin-1-like [Ornithodoros turicata]|uniref:neprilysin-1-like n=1 Tax=Ornithodoros turicata TaxID=34597 RepID=UPI00313A4BA4
MTTDIGSTAQDQAQDEEPGRTEETTRQETRDQVWLLVAAWVTAAVCGALAGVTAGGVVYLLGSSDTTEPPTMTSPRAYKVCTTPGCRFVAESLILALNKSINPCDDFYGFVCSRYQGRYERTLVALQFETWSFMTALLESEPVPQRGQTAMQKAAALYRACMKVYDEPTNNVKELKDFMGVTIGVTIALQQDTTNNVLEKIIQLAFEYDISTMMSVQFGNSLLDRNVNTFTLELNLKNIAWYNLRNEKRANLAAIYVVYFTRYGFTKQQDVLGIIQKLSALEDSATVILARKSQGIKQDSIYIMVELKSLGPITPNVRANDWLTHIKRYSNNAYSENTRVIANRVALEFIDSMIGTHTASDLKLLLAWDLLRTFLRYVDTTILRDTEEERTRQTRHCMMQAEEVMPIALAALYIYKTVTPSVVTAVQQMTEHIREAYLEAIQGAKWLGQGPMQVASAKLKAMRFHVAFPDGMRNETELNDYYKDMPDVGSDFFTSWVTAARLIRRKLLNNANTAIFPGSTVNAFYVILRNHIAILAPIINQPAFIADASASINLAGLGAIIGHEMTHGFDVTGSTIDEQGNQRDWWTQSAHDHYVSAGLCLRKSHERYVQRRADQLDPKKDSENIADFIGLNIALRTFKRLNPSTETVLPGLPYDATQLFFLSSCFKWCSKPGARGSELYAPNSARCSVPLMNIRLFSEAFGCKKGDKMNPENKCSF